MKLAEVPQRVTWKEQALCWARRTHIVCTARAITR
jgi:hypothetical protein